MFLRMLSADAQGPWLKSRIARSGLSFAAFARRVSISREHLQRLFKLERVTVYQGTMWKIVDALGLTDACRSLGYVPDPTRPDPVSGSESMADAYGAPGLFAQLIKLDQEGKLPVASTGVVGVITRPTIDANVEPYSEERIEVPIPFFDLPVAASGWVHVTSNHDGGYPVSEAQLRQGLFRVRVRGDSMQPRFPDGCVVEFRLIDSHRVPLDCTRVQIGRRYYVQLDDGSGTFKELAECDERGLILRALNRRYRKPLIAPFESIQRIALAVGRFDPET